jgi:hypothetical protein
MNFSEEQAENVTIASVKMSSLVVVLFMPQSKVSLDSRDINKVKINSWLYFSILTVSESVMVNRSSPANLGFFCGTN